LFRVPTPNRNIIQVLNGDGTKIYGTFFAIAAHRNVRPENPEVRFMETAAIDRCFTATAQRRNETFLKNFFASSRRGGEIIRPMHIRRLLLFCLLAIAVFSSADVTARAVPFKGSWTGVTVSADDSGFPVVSIVSEGGGQLTHFGDFTMVSPHTTNVATNFTAGEQIFTAANGDTMTAYCEGTPLPDFSTGNLVVSGTLYCDVLSGTGRFEDATGSYEFFLVSTLEPEPLPNGLFKFATEAEITGEIGY
jgi:hypothetical protein